MSNDSGKMVVSFGWMDMVFSLEDGVELLKLLDRGEDYKERYDSTSKSTHYYVFKDEEKNISVKVISAAKYNVAKLAGKPQE